MKNKKVVVKAQVEVEVVRLNSGFEIHEVGSAYKLNRDVCSC